MHKLLKIVGDAAAVLGILLSLIAGLARITGDFYLMGYELITLFNGGLALMVFACLAKVQQLAMR